MSRSGGDKVQMSTERISWKRIEMCDPEISNRLQVNFFECICGGKNITF